MAARAVILTCLLGFAAAEGQAPPKAASVPLVSTDLLHSTYGILSDVCSDLYLKAGVEEHLKKVPFDQLRKQAAELYQQVPPDVRKQVEQASSQASSQASRLYAQASAQLQQAEEPLAKVTDQIKMQLELAAPLLKEKGLIGQGPSNVAFFVTYMLVVLYVAVKVFLFVLRLALSIFCCICCCGCCRGSKAATEEKKGKHAKKNGQAAPQAKAEATNGKAKKK
jgi:hypothetical protein